LGGLWGLAGDYFPLACLILGLHNNRMKYCTIIFVAFFCLIPILGQSTAHGKAKFKLPHPQNHLAVWQRASEMGVPMETFKRAIEELESGVVEQSKRDCEAILPDRYLRKDVFSIFDLSRPSSVPRFFVIDLASGSVEAFHSSHGSGNGKADRPGKFTGFNRPTSHMTALGPLITDERTEPGRSGTDKAGGLRGLKTLPFRGTKRYNNNINASDDELPGGASYEFHTRDYASENFRRKNGRMGTSNGCFVLEPKHINRVVEKLKGGTLVYVAVGNEPVENYIPSHERGRRLQKTKCFEDDFDGDERSSSSGL